jgi:GT2 family glycosyltransferase
MRHEQEQIVALTEQVARLTREGVDRDRRIAALEQSASWRLTAWARYAYGLFRVLWFGTPPYHYQMILGPAGDDPQLVEEGDGARYWRAATTDPQLVASLSPGSASLGRRWHRVSVTLSQRSGHIFGPRVYLPCAAGGHTEAESFELEPVDGEYVADIFIPRPIRELRFDPSLRPCDFDAHGVQVVAYVGPERWLRAAADGLRRAARLFRHARWHTGAEPCMLPVRPLTKDPVPVAESKGRTYFRATSCEPHQVASRPPPTPAPSPGWYGVRIELAQRDGNLAGPRVYLPSPDGCTESRSVELQLVDGAFVADIYLRHRARELRFDPSIYPCDFDCEPMRLTYLGSRRWWRAAAALARAARRLNGEQRRFFLRLGLRILRTQGPRAFLEAAFLASSRGALAAPPGYSAWALAYATPGPAELADMAAECGRMKRRPLISLITPVYNTPAGFLRAMLDSVLRQAYPNWELCLADDASTDAHVRPILEEYAQRDSRIKVAWRATNGHISAASNTAIGLATGEYFALLDHDDELTPDALCWVAKELNDHPDAALVYSDEDKLHVDGALATPYFKPDWNHDLFLSHNLITHLGVYRADIVREIGGFREEFSGAQDYDLALRFIERIDPSRIRHIPRVLYHWRMLPGSTSMGGSQKSYAAERSRLAIEQHLQRRGIAASVEFVREMEAHRVRYHVPAPQPLVSIIVPTRNAKELVRQCIESVVQKTTYSRYEILLVDNGSDDPAALAYFAQLRDRGTVRLIEDRLPFNFARINNAAAKHAHGDYLLLLNSDTKVISPDWLSELVSHAQRPEVGIVGAKLWYADDTLQHAGLVLVAGAAGHAHSRKPRGDHGYMGRANLIQAVSALTAACFCIRRELFERIGGLDETLSVSFNDVDICLRLQAAGYRNIYTPYAELYHYESLTRGYEDTPAKLHRFQKEMDILRSRWMPVLLNDPHYNPNLAMAGEPFSLAWPPRARPFVARESQRQQPVAAATTKSRGAICILGGGPAALLAQAFLRRKGVEPIVVAESEFGNLRPMRHRDGRVGLVPIFPREDSELFKRMQAGPSPAADRVAVSFHGGCEDVHDAVAPGSHAEFITRTFADSRRRLVLAKKHAGAQVFTRALPELRRKVVATYPTAARGGSHLGFADGVSLYLSYLERERCGSTFGEPVLRIDLPRRRVTTRSREIAFDRLVSTLPMPEFMRLAGMRMPIELLGGGAQIVVAKAAQPVAANRLVYDCDGATPIFRAFVPRDGFVLAQVAPGQWRADSSRIAERIAQLFALDAAPHVLRRFTIDNCYPLAVSDDGHRQQVFDDLEGSGVTMFGRAAEWKYLDLDELDWDRIDRIHA